ncbi:10001_t:CDS:2, partial [Ambispora leptoticha]
GSAVYLAILSALTKKPNSAQVAATGAIAEELTKGKINDQEVSLEKGANLPISGLKEKIAACVKKGINKLVLSKYQSSPNILSEQRDLVIPQERGVKSILVWKNLFMNKLTVFDTHCHLADGEYRKQDRNTKEIIQEAEKAGVKYILNTGQDMPTNQLLLKQLEEFPNLYGALGLHPNSNEDLKEENLQ